MRNVSPPAYPLGDGREPRNHARGALGTTHKVHGALSAQAAYVRPPDPLVPGRIGGQRAARLRQRPGGAAGAGPDRGRADRPPRPRRALAAGRAAAPAGPGRGRPLRAAPGPDRPSAGPGRGRHARRPVRQAAAAAGLLPRPLGLRAAALPGHLGHVHAAALPRLPAGLPGRQLADVRGRHRADVRAGLAAGTDRGAAGRPAGRALPLLRVALLAGRPAGPGPERRPGHRAGGVGARHPDPQVLRPAPHHGPALPRAGRRAARHRAAQGPDARQPLGGDRRTARGRARLRAGGRRRPGRPRRAERGHPGGLPLHRAGAALAGGVAGLAARLQQRGGHRGGPLLRGDGRPGRHRRGLGRTPRERRRHPVHRRPVPLPRRPRRQPRPAARHRPAHPARRDDGPGRRDRQRQDHADRAAPPALRRHRRQHHGGRPGDQRTLPGQAARTGRGRLRGTHPVLRLGARERADGRS